LVGIRVDQELYQCVEHEDRALHMLVQAVFEYVLQIGVVVALRLFEQARIVIVGLLTDAINTISTYFERTERYATIVTKSDVRFLADEIREPK